MYSQSNKFQSFLEKKNFKLVLYVISLSEYHEENQFQKSIELFEKSIGSSEINTLPWLIIFNKLDILEQICHWLTSIYRGRRRIKL